MLFIIASDLVADYDKVKSSVSPKAFAKANIRCNDKKYDNSTRFYEEFFGRDISTLVDTIKEYKRIHGKTLAKDEHCLSELLKDDCWNG